MKLSKLYSNNAFHNTEFNSGLNVIFADVKAKTIANSSHSIGKTKFIQLLDFLLLKRITPKNHFLTSTKETGTNSLKFNGYEFYLEILLNSGSFLTIKRTVNDSSKISLKLAKESTNNFDIYRDWDLTNLSIEDARQKINSYFDFDFFNGNPNWDYRDTINYSLRVPDDGDYSDLFKLKKFTFDEKKWKTFMFALLGFDSSPIAEKYRNEDEIKLKTKIIKEQEVGFDIQGNQKDEIEGFVQVLTKTKQRKIQELDNLNFYSQDDRTILQLVEDIESNISELNKASYNIQFELKKINDSLKSEFSFDLNVIKEFFREMKLHFPDQLMKSYEELVDFNKQITAERKELLKESLVNKSKKLEEIRFSLFDLNKQKERFRDVLQDSTVLKKLKEYQSELIQLENDIARNEAKLDSIKVIESKKNEIVPLEKNLIIAIQKLTSILETTSSNIRYAHIRNYFSDFANSILSHPAIISLALNKNNNVEYNYKIGETKKGDGNTYKKMLCVAFDLAILAEYSSESYFKFVYHDDVFSNQENKIRVRLLNLIREFCAKYNIQYILSIIKDDLPRDVNDNFIMFSESEIIMKLNDRNDAGKLFMTSF